MKKKLMYEVPDAELIELHLENNQMQDGSLTYGDDGDAGAGQGYNRYNDDF